MHEKVAKKSKDHIIGPKNVELLWYTFLNFSGIKDLGKVPFIEDPEHQDVKAVVFLYSMESFLFMRLNELSRKKEISAI